MTFERARTTTMKIINSSINRKTCIHLSLAVQNIGWACLILFMYLEVVVLNWAIKHQALFWEDDGGMPLPFRRVSGIETMASNHH